MKILVLGDLRGDFRMLERIMEDVGVWKPDLVLFTGDVVEGKEREKLAGEMDRGKGVLADWRSKLKKVLAEEARAYRRFIEELARFRGTVRVVPGHRDAPFDSFLRSVLREARAAPHVGLVHQSFINAGRDFVLVGFGGDITADERETGLVNRFPAWEMEYHFEIMEHLPQEPILLTHYPPLAEETDVMDGRHVGSPELRELIENYRPAYVFCGHAHGSQGIEAVGESIIINPGTITEGNYAILNTRKETVRFNMLED